MAEITSNQNNLETDILSSENESSREKYPVKTFLAIENFVANVYKKYGNSEIVSAEKVADANSLAVNSIKQTLSTCQQYSTMKNIHGKGYKVTDEFTTVYHPENPEEKIQTIIKCLSNVKFYRPLFNDFEDKAVPSIEGLQNRFIREYKMKPHLAKNAAEVFLQNLKDFNLLNARNILIVPSIGITNIRELSNTENEKNIDSNNNDSDKVNNNTEDETVVKIPIRLKSNRMAYLSFPSDFKDEDLLKIFKVLKAYIEAYGDDIDLKNV